jgi:hypothetical protein
MDSSVRDRYLESIREALQLTAWQRIQNSSLLLHMAIVPKTLGTHNKAAKILNVVK